MLAASHPSPVVMSVVAGIVLLLIWVGHRQAKKNNAAVREFAARAGLSVREKILFGFTMIESLEGEHQGRRLRYWTYTTGSGKSRQTWVALSVGVPAEVALTFELTRQGLASKLREWFGAREIQVGDPAFDRAWFVRSNQPEFFAAALVPAIRARLVAVDDGQSGASYKLESAAVRYTERGGLNPRHLERLAARLPVLLDLADVAEVSLRSGA